MSESLSTLTTRVAAIEMKIFYLQYRAKKIIEDQSKLVRKSYETNRDKIKGGKNAIFNTVDIIITMEYIVGLINDIFSTPELRDKFDRDMLIMLNKSKKAAKQWKPVRNNLGGHLSIESIENICIHYNFNGVFLSDDLESDAAVLNMLMIQGAVNNARKSTDIFGRDIDLLKDMAIFNQKIDEDWKTACEIFEPMLKFLYEHGKEEKKKKTSPSTWGGIVSGD